MRNLSLLTDLYQLTMADAYIRSGKENQIAVFDLFFRAKAQINYAVFAGLEQAADYIKNLRFTEEDLSFLEELGQFSPQTLAYFRDFSFDGDVYAVPEGSVVFPGEPIVVVKAKLPQAQMLETALLNILNHQTLIASKASRVVHAAAGAPVMEFGLRRAQGPDAGILGSRASIIGGCASTSNVLAGKRFGLPLAGTHAHSFVLSFPDELTAFRAYAAAHPDNCMLLVDSYNTLKSGVPNAVTVFTELKQAGKTGNWGIRLDSGDFAYLSKAARAVLDGAGLQNVKICASGDLDEFSIQSLNSQGAKIDVWGVGTKLITSENMPSLGGVYKLSAVEENGRMIPRMKISDNFSKITNPGCKKVMRIYDRSGMAQADLVCLHDETFDTSKPLTIFHPVETWKKTTFTDYTVRPLMREIFKDGKLTAPLPSAAQCAAFCKDELATFWTEYLRFDNPHLYKVDLSDKLYDLKKKLMHAAGAD